MMPALRQFFARKSLHTQLICLGLGCVLTTATVALAVVYVGTWSADHLAGTDAQVIRLRLLAALGITGTISLAVLYTAINRLLRPLHRLRDAMWHVSEGRFDSPIPAPVHPHSRDVFGLKYTFDRMLIQLHQAKLAHDESKNILAARTRTVDRLLEFSQNIQGAGKAEQIFATLSHFLQAELSLAGLTVLTVEPDTNPPTQVRVCHPPDLMLADHPVGEMETSLCPCLRQHLPRHFRADGSPVRCSVESSLRLGSGHPAYCVPFTVGGKIQAVVHMLMPVGIEWTEESKQLAQTYVNTTQSALISLHLLAEAEKQSMTDSLTGLYNRRSLDSLLQREVALAERHHTSLSLVMIDMDKFKEVNDTYGHAAGDHMLKTFADCVRITLRRTDLAFRYGGDEFVIALPQTVLAQAQQVVNKLRQAFSAVDFTSAIAKLEHQPTLSIGVAERSAEHNVLTLPSLLTAADQALYDAKSSNRNCVKVYTPGKAA
jgi:diguanylate cyclase (GGDEF)-like protein